MLITTFDYDKAFNWFLFYLSFSFFFNLIIGVYQSCVYSFYLSLNQANCDQINQQVRLNFTEITIIEQFFSSRLLS